MELPFRLRAIGVENVPGLRAPFRLRLTFQLTAGGFVMDGSRIVTSVADAVPQTWDGVVSHGARWNNGIQASECSISTMTVVRGRVGAPRAPHCCLPSPSEVHPLPLLFPSLPIPV